MKYLQYLDVNIYNFFPDSLQRQAVWSSVKYVQSQHAEIASRKFSLRFLHE